MQIFGEFRLFHIFAAPVFKICNDLDEKYTYRVYINYIHKTMIMLELIISIEYKY